jgi:hypothetical protein
VRNMVCRIPRRGLGIEQTMRTFGVVFRAVLPAKHFCFEQMTEDFVAARLSFDSTHRKSHLHFGCAKPDCTSRTRDPKILGKPF